MINIKTILPTFLLFIYIGLEVSCVEYTVKRDRDDMVRILKEVCGSARYLLQNVMANKLRAPYVLGRGRVIRLDCFQKKNLFIYIPDKYQKSSIYVPGDSLLPTSFMDGGVTADQCKDRCASMTDCAFITYNKQGWCYFYGILYYNGRKEEEFDNDPKYDTYIRTDKDI